MPFAERYYQAEARRRTHDEWTKVRSTLVVLPTGTGKTVTFANITADRLDAGRVLILAHRGELLEQAADKLLTATGLTAAVEKAEDSALDALEMVTVGSVQTLQREKRLELFPRDHYATIIVDEAHHAISPSYRVIFDYFNDAKILGVTATADRGDKKSLGHVFDSLAYEYPLRQAIADGFLAKMKALTIPLNINLCGATVRAGDFVPEDLDSRLTPHLEAIADSMTTHCRTRKTIAFLPLIKTCKAFADVLTKKGFRAAWISGDDPDREQKRQDYHAGKYDIVCNSMLWTEGFDDPATDCIAVLRPTKIRSLYAQMIGRGTRIYPGKDHLLILDYLWNVDKHNLCHPASIIIDDDEVDAAATAIVNGAAGRPVDIDQALVDKAEHDAMHVREKALAKTLEEMRRKKSKLVDPVQYAVSVGSADLLNYQSAFGWETSPVSPDQAKALEKAGILPDGVKDAGQATAILADLAKRRAAQLASPKQVRRLESYGFEHVGTMTAKQATHLITRIAANGWRVPHDINPKKVKTNGF